MVASRRSTALLALRVSGDCIKMRSRYRKSSSSGACIFLLMRARSCSIGRMVGGGLLMRDIGKESVEFICYFKIECGRHWIPEFDIRFDSIVAKFFEMGGEFFYFLGVSQKEVEKKGRFKEEFFKEDLIFTIL